MKVLIVYGSTEGYTRKIATFIAGHLAQARHAVTLVDATEAPSSVAVNEYDAILIAASVHLGRYQSSIVHFAQSHREALNARKAGFISVSLAAVSDDRDDREGLRNCVAEFARETRWLPSEVLHAAGALRFTQYDFFKRWALKYIAYRKGAPTDTSTDHEFTDWQALTTFVDEFVTKRQRDGIA
jgi:menaquinone-dependent protoporphyrinogen oxidase